MDKLTAARQLRRAIEIFAQSLELDDSTTVEISGLYPAWRPGQEYTTGQIISYGEVGEGEPQLYRVLQGHTSQDDWRPDVAVSLYKMVPNLGTEETTPTGGNTND